MASGDGVLGIPKSQEIRLPSGAKLKYQENSSCYAHFCKLLRKLHLNDFPHGSFKKQSQIYKVPSYLDDEKDSFTIDERSGKTFEIFIFILTDDLRYVKAQNL